MVTTYSEYDAGPADAPRGEALNRVADGGLWVFLVMEPTEDDSLKIRLDMHDVIDTGTLRALLTKVLNGIPD